MLTSIKSPLCPLQNAIQILEERQHRLIAVSERIRHIVATKVLGMYAETVLLSCDRQLRAVCSKRGSVEIRTGHHSSDRSSRSVKLAWSLASMVKDDSVLLVAVVNRLSELVSRRSKSENDKLFGTYDDELSNIYKIIECLELLTY